MLKLMITALVTLTRDCPPQSSKTCFNFWTSKACCEQNLGLLDHDCQINSKYPVLFPTKHHLTSLIINQCHNATFHGEVTETP